MRWVIACVLLVGCPRAGPVVAAPDAAIELAPVDAGPLVTEARLAAWLSWQQALSTLPVADGGDSLRRRARLELALLADAGLTIEQADALEAVISAVVAERNVYKLSGADALMQFKAGLAQLTPEQRARAEKALAELQARTPDGGGSLVAVEAQFGAEAVRVVLSREAEVTKTWDALLEKRQGP